MSKHEWDKRSTADDASAARDGDPAASQRGATEQNAGHDGASESSGADATSARPRTLDKALDEIDALRSEVEAKTVELAQTKDLLLRERADLENFKRRMQREKAESLRYASESLLRDLLPVVDNLERAVGAASTAPANESPAQTSRIEGLVTGVKMVLQQFVETLGRHGVTRVASVGQTFDPNHHEAVAHVESDAQPAGSVVEEYASGYRFHDRLLRPAHVTVAKGPRVH